MRRSSVTRAAAARAGVLSGEIWSSGKRDEMGGMPVVGFGLIEVFKPLLQLAMLANLQRWQAILAMAISDRRPSSRLSNLEA